MSNCNDINDNEIRIIRSKRNPESTPGKSHRRKRLCTVALIAGAAVLLIAILASIWFIPGCGNTKPTELYEPQESAATPVDSAAIDKVSANGFVVVSDTAVGARGAKLTLLEPKGLRPTLAVGEAALSEPGVMMAVPAADIRSDNGGIVGAFVKEGELLSKGQSKAGFCAIIEGRMTIGVSDSSPLLEQALETDGYFFRQYPLVVANQVVENKPKGASLRKALAEIGGRTIVVISSGRMTFHNFSQALVDLGVDNAIYLVGSSVYGFAIDSVGRKREFGEPTGRPAENASYIIWR